MTDELKTIHVDGASELAHLLAEADTHPLRLTTGAASYRVERERQVGPHDVSSLDAMIDALAGSWSDLDTDKLIEDLYRAREEGTRPADRP